MIMTSNVLVGLGVNVLFAGIAFGARSVTVSGALSGILLGTWIYSFMGIRGFSVVVFFFVLGSFFTRLGFGVKASRGIAQKKGGRRTYKEGFANTLIGAIGAALSFFTGDPLYAIGFVASFATALADTTATELGSLYGRKTFLVHSFKKVPAGTAGAVSLEGTLFGIVGAALLAILAFFLMVIRKRDIFFVVAGAILGFVAESFLAQVPRISHEGKNFLNTLLGALFAMAFAFIFR